MECRVVTKGFLQREVSPHNHICISEVQSFDWLSSELRCQVSRDLHSKLLPPSAPRSPTWGFRGFHHTDEVALACAVPASVRAVWRATQNPFCPINHGVTRKTSPWGLNTVKKTDRKLWEPVVLPVGVGDDVREVILELRSKRLWEVTRQRGRRETHMCKDLSPQGERGASGEE